MRALIVAICLCWSMCGVADTWHDLVAKYLNPRDATELRDVAQFIRVYMEEHRGQRATAESNRNIESFYLQSIGLQDEEGKYPIRQSSIYAATEANAESVLCDSARSDSQIFYFLGQLMQKGGRFADQLSSEFIPELGELFFPEQQLLELAASKNNFVAMIALVVAHNQDPRGESEFANVFTQRFIDLIERTGFSVSHIADFEGLFAKRLFEMPTTLKLSHGFWRSLLNKAEELVHDSARIVARTAEYRLALQEDPKLAFLFLGPGLELLWLYKSAEIYRTKDSDTSLEQQFQGIYAELKLSVLKTRAYIPFDYLSFELLTAFAEAKVLSQAHNPEIKTKLTAEIAGKRIVKRQIEPIRNAKSLNEFQQVITQLIHRAVAKHSVLDLLANGIAIETIGGEHKAFAEETHICQVAFGF